MCMDITGGGGRWMTMMLSIVTEVIYMDVDINCYWYYLLTLVNNSWLLVPPASG